MKMFLLLYIKGTHPVRRIESTPPNQIDSIINISFVFSIPHSTVYSSFKHQINVREMQT